MIKIYHLWGFNASQPCCCMNNKFGRTKPK